MTTQQETKSSVLNEGQSEWLAATLRDGREGKDGTKLPPADMNHIAAGGEVVALKIKLLNDARKTIDSKVGEIAIGQDFEVNLKKGGLEGFLRDTFNVPKKIGSISKGTDNPDDELDTEHDKTQGVDPETYQKLMRAQAIISGEVTRLLEAKDKNGIPVPFSKIEIANAIWAPLMRRKVIPENAIPDQYQRGHAHLRRRLG